MKRNCLITGGGGFIGSALLRYVVPKFSDIIFVNIDDKRNGYNEESLKKVEGFTNYAFIYGDIKSLTIEDIFERFKITDVIHLAAQTDVDESIFNPYYTVENNVIGTLNLLESARKQEGFKRFLYVSTDEVTGEIEYTDPLKTENDQQKPGNPYSASKTASEALVMAYKKTYGIDTVITPGGQIQ